MWMFTEPKIILGNKNYGFRSGVFKKVNGDVPN